MIIIKSAVDLKDSLDSARKKGQTIGFVPTMGALHPGHVSLVETCKKENDLSLCSIFINPTQFNDAKDLEKYPVTLASDIENLEAAECDILFLPHVSEIYPESFQPPHYDLGYLEEILEGKFRPGHFQGVCMVIDRFLVMTNPDRLYLGQKDFQQCMVVKKLLELLALEDTIELKICPTLREPDGLAMSSRNVRLSKDERKRASEIFQTLQFIRLNLELVPLTELKILAVERLTQKGFNVDYVEIAKTDDLVTAHEVTHGTKLVALIAAFNNEVRLIDNMILSPSNRTNEKAFE
jgi:pantoate--beta-alanine ligase